MGKYEFKDLGLSPDPVRQPEEKGEEVGWLKQKNIRTFPRTPSFPNRINGRENAQPIKFG